MRRGSGTLLRHEPGSGSEVVFERGQAFVIEEAEIRLLVDTFAESIDAVAH